MVSANLGRLPFKACVLVGATASGKSELAHTLFSLLKSEGITCEIVNTDAFQIYRGVTAGTAKPGENEVKDYCYHGVDILDAHECIDANQLARRWHEACYDIYCRGSLPICVGGSGLYLRAFLHGLNTLPPRNDELRIFFRECADAWGWESLHAWLKVLDPKRASAIHPNDKTRIERALEISFVTGKAMSQLSDKGAPLHQQPMLFDCCVIRIEREAEEVLSRIQNRTRVLLQSGWIEEVDTLYRKYGDALLNFQSFKAIGYRDVLDAILAGNVDLDILSNKISTLTWQYARRQRTWNAKEMSHCVWKNEAQTASCLLELIRFWRG